MNVDLTNLILPIINASGVPLLAIGIIVLIVTYHRAVQTSKEIASGLAEENKRLRESLHSSGLDYVDELKKMKLVVSKVDNAVEELTVAKAAMLAQAPTNTHADEMVKLQAVQIDLAIQSMNGLLEMQSEFEFKFEENQLSISRSLQELKNSFREVKHAISQFADTISDNNSRVLVLSILASEDSLSRVKTIAKENPVGLTGINLSESENAHSFLPSKDDDKSNDEIGDESRKNNGLLESNAG